MLAPYYVLDAKDDVGFPIFHLDPRRRSDAVNNAMADDNTISGEVAFPVRQAGARMTIITGVAVKPMFQVSLKEIPL